jgi:hypothetical protein
VTTLADVDKAIASIPAPQCYADYGKTYEVLPGGAVKEILYSGPAINPEAWPEQEPLKSGCYRDGANNRPFLLLRPWQLGAILAVVSAAFFFLGVWVMRG